MDNSKLKPDLKSPKDLFRWMNKNIKYGFNINHPTEKEKYPGENFFKYYKLQTPEELLKSKMGVCWDQTYFEKRWMNDRGIETIEFYIELQVQPEYPTHTFLLYKMGNDWYYFENSFGAIRQNSKIKSIKNIVNMIIDSMIEFEKTRRPKDFKYDKKETFISILKGEPPYGKGVMEFMAFGKSFPNVYNMLSDMKY